MSGIESLLKPEECALLLVDFQARLAFGVESISRQTIVDNPVALARTVAVFGSPLHLLCNEWNRRERNSRAGFRYCWNSSVTGRGTQPMTELG
jgi:hypothetical protein